MKIGIFGGTFSPPHMGHVRAAREFIIAMELDKLLVIPTSTSPHKAMIKTAAPELRLEMCRIAFDMGRCEVSDIEIRRGGKSYTVLTLEELRDIYPKDELMFLCGTDMFLTLDRWFRAADIFKICTIVYVRREVDIVTEREIKEKIDIYREQYGAKIRHISPRPTELSSTEVRDVNKNDGDISEMVPPAVEEFIRCHGLYE
ncbi:MAG: nicotinate (nicotinamide) nucleotide adenylyltransferase [Clostridia bacterium]|nr:nicotinate (nicotinamide) nucleotide adenylyltransferase [Clostridia bacterium]